MVWRLYYQDRSSFSSEDGDWADAPPWGVMGVAHLDDWVGYERDTGDFYVFAPWADYPWAWMKKADGFRKQNRPEIVCTGRGDASGGHCCVIQGQACQHLVDRGTPGDQRFRCALRTELGSWEAVHDDPRYQVIANALIALGTDLCGDWQPSTGQCCREAR